MGRIPDNLRNLDEVHVTKQALLEALKTNLHEHLQVYDHATAGWAETMKSLSLKLAHACEDGDWEKIAQARGRRPASRKAA